MHPSILSAHPAVFETVGVCLKSNLLQVAETFMVKWSIRFVSIITSEMPA